jgi:hypothetical protein
MIDNPQMIKIMNTTLAKHIARLIEDFTEVEYHAKDMDYRMPGKGNC